jgi:hypothetical protein
MMNIPLFVEENMYGHYMTKMEKKQEKNPAEAGFLRCKNMIRGC